MMMYWSPEDDALIVEVPEFSEGEVDTAMYSEAIQYAEMTIQEWVKTAVKVGREISLPKEDFAQA